MLSRGEGPPLLTLTKLFLMRPKIAIGLLCCEDALLVIHQDPKVPLNKATFQLVSPQHVLLHGVTPPEVQDFVFPLVESQEVSLGPVLWPSGLSE